MHKARLDKMEADMKNVFQQKVQEKEQKLKKSRGRAVCSPSRDEGGTGEAAPGTRGEEEPTRDGPCWRRKRRPERVFRCANCSVVAFLRLQPDTVAILSFCCFRFSRFFVFNEFSFFFLCLLLVSSSNNSRCLLSLCVAKIHIA